jgi:hypothetical protein
MSFIYNILSLLDATPEGQSIGDRATVLMKLWDSLNFNMVYVGLYPSHRQWCFFRLGDFIVENTLVSTGCLRIRRSTFTTIHVYNNWSLHCYLWIDIRHVFCHDGLYLRYSNRVKQFNLKVRDGNIVLIFLDINYRPIFIWDDVSEGELCICPQVQNLPCWE